MSKGIVHLNESYETAVRLICLPHAGGSAQTFTPWSRHLPQEIELCAVQWPGRESRKAEPFKLRMELLIASLADEIEPYLDLPYALYGHSMGAMASYALARELKRRGAASPIHMFLAASRAPHVPLARKPMHQLNEADFLTEMIRLGGTPAEVMKDLDLIRALIPMIRADFEALETYRPFEAPAKDDWLACGMSIYGGEGDHVSIEALAAWENLCAGAFRLKMMPGSHFFVKDQMNTLIKEITVTLFRLLRGAPPFADETPAVRASA